MKEVILEERDDIKVRTLRVCTAYLSLAKAIPVPFQHHPISKNRNN